MVAASIGCSSRLTRKSRQRGVAAQSHLREAARLPTITTEIVIPPVANHVRTC